MPRDQFDIRRGAFVDLIANGDGPNDGANATPIPSLAHLTVVSVHLQPNKNGVMLPNNADDGDVVEIRIVETSEGEQDLWIFNALGDISRKIHTNHQEPGGLPVESMALRKHPGDHDWRVIYTSHGQING